MKWLSIPTNCAFALTILYSSSYMSSRENAYAYASSCFQEKIMAKMWTVIHTSLSIKKKNIDRLSRRACFSGYFFHLLTALVPCKLGRRVLMEVEVYIGVLFLLSEWKCKYVFGYCFSNIHFVQSEIKKVLKDKLLQVQVNLVYFYTCIVWNQ